MIAETGNEVQMNANKKCTGAPQHEARFLFLLMAAAIWIFLLTASCGPEGQPEQAIQQESRPVKMLEVLSADSLPPLNFPAVIRSAERTELAFTVSGILTELPVVEGRLVQRGTVLARLDDRDVRIRLEADKAAYDLALANYERAQRLAEAQIIAAAELDQLRAAHESAKAILATTRKTLEDTVLHAPFDGVVSIRYVNNFQNIQAKQPIVLFQSPDRLEAVVEIPEPLILRTSRGEDRPDEALVRFDAQPDVALPARFKEVSTEANPRTQTFQAVFSLERPDDLLVLPGVTATLTVERGSPSKTPIFVLPPRALITDASGQTMVWVYGVQTGQAHRREVTVGAPRADGIEVISGLEPGERVIVSGLGHLREGLNVRPMTPLMTH